MPIERVDRPGESQEATGGKKKAKERWTEKKTKRWFQIVPRLLLVWSGFPLHFAS